MRPKLLHLILILTIVLSLFQVTSPAVTAAESRQVVPPNVTTDNATSITSSSAVLNGTLTSKGTATNVSVSFEWGPTVLCENTAPSLTMNSTGNFSVNLTWLVPGATYYFRAKAAGDGTSYGNTANFTTVTVADANNDGLVNAIDITRVERITAGLDAGTPGADANQDGSINALDITKVELIIVGLGGPRWVAGRYFPQFPTTDRVYVIPVHTVLENHELTWTRDFRINRFPEIMMALTLVGMQGVINRSQPSIYLA